MPVVSAAFELFDSMLGFDINLLQNMSGSTKITGMDRTYVRDPIIKLLVFGDVGCGLFIWCDTLGFDGVGRVGPYPFTRTNQMLFVHQKCAVAYRRIQSHI